jgi:hypothetical protein
MALPGFDAGIRLRAATESPLAPVFYETDPGGAAERIFQVARVFVARSIKTLIRAASRFRESSLLPAEI